MVPKIRGREVRNIAHCFSKGWVRGGAGGYEVLEVVRLVLVEDQKEM